MEEVDTDRKIIDENEEKSRHQEALKNTIYNLKRRVVTIYNSSYNTTSKKVRDKSTEKNKSQMREIYKLRLWAKLHWKLWIWKV